MRRFSLLALLPLVVGLIVWEWLVRAQLLPPANSASASDTMVTLGRLLGKSEMYSQIGYTLGRLFAGTVLGVVVAVPFALWMAVIPVVRRTFHPTLVTCGNIPVIVWIPFAVMIFGTDEALKVALITIAAFLTTGITVFDAAAKTHLTLLEAGRALHLKGSAFIRHVLLPAVTPALIGAIRASIAFGWVVVFFAEYASARTGSEGLGWFIANARAIGRIEEEFAGLAILASVALILDALINVVQGRTTRWMHVTDTA